MKKIVFLLLVFLFTTYLLANQSSVYATVIFEDHFENDLSQWELRTGQNISLTSNLSHSPNKSVRISFDQTTNKRWASHLFPEPISARVAVMIYDDLSLPSGNYAFLSLTDKSYTKGLSIGIRPSISQTNYVYCPTENLDGCMDTGMPRRQGWRQFKIFATPKGTYGKIDGQAFSYLPANTINPAVNANFLQFQRVNFGVLGTTGSGAVYFDDVYIDSFPPPPSDAEIAMNYINLFLSTYTNIDVVNIDRMIKAREAEFCPTDPPNDICPDGSGRPPHWHYNEQLFHVYRGLYSTAVVHIANYIKTKNENSLGKAVEIIRYLDGEYERWKQNKSGSIVGYGLAMTSWLIWPKLPTGLRDSIRSHLVAEGEYFKNTYRPYSEYIGNSSGEENSWPGLYLNTLSLMFADLPQAGSWTERAKFFAFHSLTKNESFGGYTSRTIYDDYLFDNHDYHPHPSYGMGTAVTLAWMERLSKKVKGSAPEEFKHNVLPVWQKMLEYVDLRTFQYKGNKIIRRGRDFNGDGQPDYTPSGNAFIPSGKNDWGDDASGPIYQVMKDVYGLAANSATDPETGFSSNDLARHAMEFIYYIHSGYIWRYEIPNVQLNEMLIDQDPGKENRVSYRWWKNAELARAYAYTYLMSDPTFSFPLTSSGGLAGDLNRDGKVDILDLRLLLANFTNIFDYNILVSNWGK